jgi:hypothetical protein
MQITNNQLKAILNAELGMSTINFVDVLCALEVLCARFKVPYQQANEVIPMVLAERFTEDQLFIKPVQSN